MATPRNPNWSHVDEWHNGFLFTVEVVQEMSEREYYWFTGGAEQVETEEQRNELVSNLRSAGFVVRETTDQNGDHCHYTVLL